MSSKQRRQLRQQAFNKQRCRCYYCNFPIWDGDGDGFSRAYGLPPRFVDYLRCTAEHLVARQDDGHDTADNIVAACAWCNRMRHQGRTHRAPEAAAYKLQVLLHVAAGRWHPLAASKRLK